MLQIVHVIRDLDIASGGPSRSVPALARSLTGLEGVKVSLLYQDRGHPVVPFGEDGVAYRAVPASDFLVANRFLNYLPRQAIAEKQCLFHLHGLWSPSLHLACRFAARQGLPYVVSPRGMLAGWALKHRSLKKSLGWQLYQRRDLERAACLLATSEAEQRDVRGLLPDQKVAVLPNICEKPSGLPSSTNKAQEGLGDRLVLALGRLHPVKGFAELIQAWARLRPAGWRLAIAGPDEGGYRAQLEELIRGKGLSEEIQIPGAVDDRQKWAWLDLCDLFIAPSRTENFGMAVAEAMLSGKPVITTTGTPWSCLPEIGAGWWVDPSPEALAAALQEAMDRPPADRQAMGERAREYARRYEPENIAREMLGIYRWLVFGEARPTCVALPAGG